MSTAPWDDSGRDDGLWDDDFDPDTSPPDGEDAWLNDLPLELREEHLTGAWTGAGESMAAGFVHHAGGRPGVGFAASGVLDQLVPGQVLAGFAADAWAGGLAELGESELVGVMCAWRRLASWAAAGESAAVTALARRRAVQARERKSPNLIDHVGDELAAALTLTGRSGKRLLDLAAGLARLEATRAALAAGVIDWPRAMIFADELVALDDDEARAAEAMVLPRAGQLTTGQLRAALRRAVLAIDPAAAGRRRRAARKDAGVHVWDEASGNSALAGRELPPEDVIIADQWLTAQARWLKARGVEGTLDQLRGSVFSTALAGRPVASLLPGTDPVVPDPAGPGPAGPDQTGRRASAAVPHTGSADHESGWPTITGNVNLTMPLASWIGISEAPGEVPGFGPADAGTCRGLAGWLAAHPASRWCLTLTDRDGRAVAHACARHGPGPPGPAQAAAWLGTLRPVALEAGECTHERQAPGYRPPRRLRHLIAVRQQTCGFPGCRRPATGCDDDHTTPYHLGGRTCECNLAPLCRHHHQAKQALGWHLEQPEPGVLIWTLPHGRSYLTRPDPYPI
jgi:hypothetical protein